MNLEVQNKSIAFVINSLEGGGAERVICTLLGIMQQSFQAQGYKVHLVLLDDLEERQTCPAYVTKHTLDAKGAFFSSYFQMNQWLEQNNPDVLVSFLTRSNLVCSILSKRLNIPNVISERVNTTSHFATSRFGFISRFLVGLLYPKSDIVVPVSKGVMQDLTDNYNVSANQCRVLYNAYDQEKLNLLAAKQVDDLPKKPYIIGIGRLVENKNFTLAIKAYAKSDTMRDLVILGQGPELEDLQVLAASVGVESRVHFLGFRENPYPCLKNADYLVSSSNAEGFPNGIAEAMCLGKAIIATNCESGPAEILTGDHLVQTSTFEQAEFGVLCAVNNEQALADAINTIESEDLIQHYSEMSLQRASAFTYQHMHDRFVEILNLVLTNESTRDSGN